MAVLLMAVCLPTAAPAGIKIEGDASAVKVEASDAPLSELLEALKKSFGLEFRSSAPLNMPINGSFSGSLQEVVTSVLFLKDFNFVYAASKTGPVVDIFNPSGEGADSPGVPRNTPMATAALPPPNGGARPLPPGGPHLAGRGPGKRED
ncbi:hypothetical protein [Methylocystis heyeri]|uniref:Uncharacterized protein n=1 Tax=Methylocystis heyeri TaxID=391905 RepID=A0A6B8KIA2_9HYPH|nr:hypothetical protein [Methylocystis heyeri]QGM46761.1 hypothetical protein H2LOC_014255 [Methylocystis heyeri]